MATPSARRPPGGLSDSSWVVDLDGVMWLADQPIPGSADAVHRLRDHGVRVVFASNNSAPTVGELLARLAGAGVATEPEDLLTSAQAAASMLAPGSQAFVCAGPGVVEALEERGVRVVGRGSPAPAADAVVVGWTRQFDFALLAETVALVRGGARFIGTNEDATYPMPDGLLPGAGALLSAVATAGQRAPEVAGKPHAPMAELIRARVPAVSMIVGDRPSTDGVLARRLGAPFGLVRSGVSGDGREPMVVEPDEDAADLAALVSGQLS